jgi:hypothetical protein
LLYLGSWVCAEVGQNAGTELTEWPRARSAS